MMPLTTRLIAVLTVMLGLATMAVSAYAARIEAGTYDSAYASAQPDDGQSGRLARQDVQHSRIEATPTVAAAPTPTPLRYPVPESAASAGPAASARSDLSPGPQIWPVRSLAPRPVNLSNLIQGGLDIPPDQLAVMQQVSLWSGVPWQVLAAIAKVESNFGRNMATSSAGAIGYGQFLPEMWDIFGNGGDPYDYRDALPAMARYLLRAGAPLRMREAIYSYNHSWSYVDLVLSYAEAYGYRQGGAVELLIWPAMGPLSRGFLPGDHLGIDIDLGAQPGGAIRAAHEGVVLFAGGDPCCGYGHHVVLVAPSGILTLYGHLDAVLVINGQTVRQGEILGTSGCTGRCTGTHLHFEVIEDSVRRDPMPYLP